MISSVFLSGRLGEKVDEPSGEMRYVEIDRLIPSKGKFLTDKIPVRTMAGSSSTFMKSPLGSLIILKGRIECDEKVGVILIDEIDEIFAMAGQPRKTSVPSL